MKKQISLCHLYAHEMNIYGDTGNVLVLLQRLRWRGIEVEVSQVGIGETLPPGVDIIVAGGGQDQGQSDIEPDLLSRRAEIKAMADDGVTMLLICGSYQLFGHRFVTGKNQEIKGLGVLDIETFASQERMIGNITINSLMGDLVGYENHSGQTYLGSGLQPLGTVISGGGNNGADKTEGALFNNVFGTYLHGPILPKNPHFADELIIRALSRKYGDGQTEKLEPLDDAIE